MRNAPVLLLLLSATAAADSYTAKVIGVADGDTITVQHNNRSVRIELYGVDCPEKKQPFGRQARQFTREMVLGKKVKIEAVVTGRYSRAAVVFVKTGETIDHYKGGRSKRAKLYKCLNDELVKAGLAWHDRSTRKNKLAKIETDARKAKRGLWAEKNPLPPWDWRRGGARTTGSRRSLASRVGRRVQLQGRAAEAKAGSVVVMDATNEPVYVKGLQGWGKLLGKRVIVTGVLRQRKMIPDPVDRNGAISQGAVGRQYLVENGRWSRACRSDRDCRLIKCCCDYIALARGETPSQRCNRPCMCSRVVRPSGVVCRAGVCEVRKKAPRPKRDACYKRCLRRSSMQAVSWEAIRAQCSNHCNKSR